MTQEYKAKAYIDAEKLIHDLEERIYAYSKGYANGDNYRKDAIETLLKDVKYQLSLQQEQPKMDLAEEITIFFSKNPIPHGHITDWPLLKNTAIHFYELGLNARKEE